MKKLTLLLFLLPTLAWSQKLTVSQADSLRALNDVKYKFVVSFDRMLYEYALRVNCETVDSLQKEIIRGYEQLTGLQARSTEDLKKAYEIKQEVSRASEDLLNAAIGSEKQAIRRKNFWKTTAIVGIPASIVGGFVLATKIK